MKIDSYANIILTLDDMFSEIDDIELLDGNKRSKYEIKIKLIETQLKAIEKQKLLDTASIDETKLTKLVIEYTELTIDDEKNGVKTKKTTTTNIKKKSSVNR